MLNLKFLHEFLEYEILYCWILFLVLVQRTIVRYGCFAAVAISAFVVTGVFIASVIAAVITAVIIAAVFVSAASITVFIGVVGVTIVLITADDDC